MEHRSLGNCRETLLSTTRTMRKYYNNIPKKVDAQNRGIDILSVLSVLIETFTLSFRTVRRCFSNLDLSTRPAVYSIAAKPRTPAAAAPAAIITPVGWLATPPVLELVDCG